MTRQREALRRQWAAMNGVGLLVAVLSLSYLLVALFLPALFFDFPPGHFLTVHTALEFSTIVVGLSGFAVVWHTLPYHRRGWLFLAAMGLLASSLLDFAHTLSYQGMPGFLAPASAPRATTYWILARLAGAAGFLAGALCPTGWRAGGRARTLVAVPLALVAMGVALVSRRPELLPPMYLQGQGMTGAKVAMEYLIILIFSLSAVLYWRRYWREGEEVAYSLLLALCVSVFSELAFTRYRSVYDTYNLLGHVYKIISYSLVLRAVFTHSVQRPYHELVETRNRLEQAYQRLESLVERRTQQLLESNRLLQEAAARDSLTGVFNRGYLTQRFEELLGRAKQAGEPLAIIILDIDHFKEINDRWGHQLGDRCLRLLVELLRPHLRRDDLLARYGGDEFVILLPSTSKEDAREVAERLRLVVETQTAAPSFTLSLGVAVYPADGDGAERLLQRADQALYRAKTLGRNRVVTAWEAAS